MMRPDISSRPRGRLARTIAIAGALTGLAAAPALAGPHGGGGGPGMGGMAGLHGDFGGLSASHMSAFGLANTNGPAAMDRDFGKDRASDRSRMRLNARSASISNGLHAADRDRGRDRASDRAHRHGKS